MTQSASAIRAAGLGPARSLAPSAAFWAAMLAASALGTNLGDYWTDQLSLGLAASAAPLALASLALIVADRFRPSEALFWLAIVILRAMATNIGDFLTDELGIGRPALTLALGAATLAAGWLTTRGASPRIDARYWVAMAIGGVFGTVGGDLVSHAVGLPFATAGLSALLVAAIAVRAAAAPAAALGYWAIVLAERAAGTAAGDFLAEERGHALALGLPGAMAIYAGLLLALLWVRSRRVLANG
jgi:uncharacterized membrane-anchored protein